jgi:hypothetical protein
MPLSSGKFLDVPGKTIARDDPGRVDTIIFYKTETPARGLLRLKKPAPGRFHRKATGIARKMKNVATLKIIIAP